VGCSSVAGQLLESTSGPTRTRIGKSHDSGFTFSAQHNTGAGSGLISKKVLKFEEENISIAHFISHIVLTTSLQFFLDSWC
jgi:hypothetical protein